MYVIYDKFENRMRPNSIYSTFGATKNKTVCFFVLLFVAFRWDTASFFFNLPYFFQQRSDTPTILYTRFVGRFQDVLLLAMYLAGRQILNYAQYCSTCFKSHPCPISSTWRCWNICMKFCQFYSTGFTWIPNKHLKSKSTTI